ncbi:homeobox-leucine zipper protein ATHB-X-like [Andrographis paniculata]|uniref:homeobox-leucine zipper protein ATHB-X-like n=1 Tax=Andrographis paniculata TaxID=175694 RepID=UPI0021E89F78|nr:homeobox-leucine zipper protein ATHB-X-like [Andrographis paniculata]
MVVFLLKLSSMNELCKNSFCLNLSIATPPSIRSSGQRAMKELLDINEVPSPEQLVTEEESEEEDEESPNIGDPNPNPRKKLRLTKHQSRLLEESFRQNQTLNPKQKEILADQLKLRARQVEVWFQNRRARRKMKQAEVECEYLKRWLRSLTEQNRRLQKEVQDLRAIKATAGRRLPPPTSAVTMCPCCQRVTTTTTTTTAAAATLPFLHPHNYHCTN